MSRISDMRSTGWQPLDLIYGWREVIRGILLSESPRLKKPVIRSAWRFSLLSENLHDESTHYRRRVSEASLSARTGSQLAPPFQDLLGNKPLALCFRSEKSHKAYLETRKMKILLLKWKLKLLWGSILPESELISPRKTMATNTGENIGKGEPPFPADVNANWYSHYGRASCITPLSSQRTPHPLRDARPAYPCFHPSALSHHKEMRAGETSSNR